MTTKRGSKLYYSITEVAEIADIEPYILRYWESEFSILHPKKNRAGNRIYRDKDIDIVFLIKYLLYEEGYTIDGAKRKIRRYKEKDIPLDNLAQGSLEEEYYQVLIELLEGLKELKQMLSYQ